MFLQLSPAFWRSVKLYSLTPQLFFVQCHPNKGDLRGGKTPEDSVRGTGFPVHLWSSLINRTSRWTLISMFSCEFAIDNSWLCVKLNRCPQSEKSTVQTSLMMATERAPALIFLCPERSHRLGAVNLSLWLLSHNCLTVTICVYILVPYKRWSSGLQSGERHDGDLSLVLCCHLFSEVWFSLPICWLLVLMKIQSSTEFSHSAKEETEQTLSSSTATEGRFVRFRLTRCCHNVNVPKNLWYF